MKPKTGSRALGVTEFLAKRFETFPFTGRWADSFGQPETNFTALIYGASGHGKTEFCIQFAKYMASFGKVYYNSFEQGVSESLQTSLRRNNMQEVSGKIIFGNRESFLEMFDRLKRRNSPQIVFIDSRDFMHLETEQYQLLVTTFPRKVFIIICWEKNGKPKGEHAAAIEYMADIKIKVKNFIAMPSGRFGGNEPFIIWERKKPVPAQTSLEL